jgi:hypothetical protein
MRFVGNAPQVFGGKVMDRIDGISSIEAELLRQFMNAIAPFNRAVPLCFKKQFFSWKRFRIIFLTVT